MSLKNYDWQYSYKTSQLRKQGSLSISFVNSISFLQRIVRYDRVAGYFRSSSLALASRGMTALISRNGKVRIIAGADMSPQDVPSRYRRTACTLRRAFA